MFVWKLLRTVFCCAFFSDDELSNVLRRHRVANHTVFEISSAPPYGAYSQSHLDHLNLYAQSVHKSFNVVNNEASTNTATFNTVLRRSYAKRVVRNHRSDPVATSTTALLH